MGKRWSFSLFWEAQTLNMNMLNYIKRSIDLWNVIELLSTCGKWALLVLIIMMSKRSGFNCTWIGFGLWSKQPLYEVSTWRNRMLLMYSWELYFELNYWFWYLGKVHTLVGFFHLFSPWHGRLLLLLALLSPPHLWRVEPSSSPFVSIVEI